MRDGIFGLSSVLLGALAAGVSIVIVMGSILLAFSETGKSPALYSKYLKHSCKCKHKG